MWSLSTCVDEAAAETLRGRREGEAVIVVGEVGEVGEGEDDADGTEGRCVCLRWRLLRGAAFGAPAVARGAQNAAACHETRRDEGECVS